MRTIGKLRHDLKLKAPINKDSLYKPIVREARKFNPLKIPKKLEKALPFKTKPKVNNKKKKNRKSEELAATAVVMEPKERKMYTMMQKLRTVRNVKTKKRKLIEKERNKRKQKERERIAAKFAVIEREKKKKKWPSKVLKGIKRQNFNLSWGRKSAVTYC